MKYYKKHILLKIITDINNVKDIKKDKSKKLKEIYL